MPTTNTTTPLKQFHNELLKYSGAAYQNADPQRSIHTQRYLNMLRNFRNILKVVIVLSLVLSSTFFLKSEAALAGGGFAQSCNSLILYKQNPGMLYGHCRRADGSWNEQARIQLSDWITNNNGRLAWQQNGGFMGSCEWNTDDFENTALLQSPEQNFIVFQTFCRNNEGNRGRTGINLNERILNDNGDLKYGGE